MMQDTVQNNKACDLYQMISKRSMLGAIATTTGKLELTSIRKDMFVRLEAIVGAARQSL